MLKEIEKETDLKKIYKILSDYRMVDKYCSDFRSSGAFGEVSINKIPTLIKIGDDWFDEPVVKDLLDNGESTISFAKKKGYLYMINSGDPFGEVVLGTIVSNLFYDKITPHVVALLGHSKCSEGTEIVYENLTYGNADSGIAGDFRQFGYYMRKMNKKVSGEMLDSFIIQIFHTIFVLNSRFKLIHFDLEDRNIFVKELTDDPYYGVESMLEYDYLVYHLPDGKKLYTKNNGYLLKIGDLGGSVANYGKLIIENNFASSNLNSQKIRKFYPNYPKVGNFLPDAYSFVRRLAFKFGLHGSLLFKMLTQIPFLTDMLVDEDMIYTETDIPNIQISPSELKKVVPVEVILSGDIFTGYHKVPEDMKKGLDIYY